MPPMRIAGRPGSAGLPAFQPWLPATLLPARPQTAIPAPPPLVPDDHIVAWRLHVRDIAAEGLPAGNADWQGVFLRFTATWSHESKRTSVTKANGGFRWRGERVVLALPNADEGGGRDAAAVPPSDLQIALCARVAGKPDEVLATGKLHVDEQAASVRGMQLLAPVWHGVSASVDFAYDVKGLSRDEADREWTVGEAELEAAEAAAAREGRDFEARSQLLRASQAAEEFPPRPSSGHHAAGAAADEPPDSPEGVAAALAASSASLRGRGSAAVEGAAPRDIRWPGSPDRAAGRPAPRGPSGRLYNGRSMGSGRILAEPTSQAAADQLARLSVGRHNVRAAWGDASESSPAMQPPHELSPAGFPISQDATPALGVLSPGRMNATVDPTTTGLRPAPASPQKGGKGKGKKPPPGPRRPASAAPIPPASSVLRGAYEANRPPPRPPDEWLRPQSAPSARLLLQLDECARIKAAFARRGLQCPTAAIEGGLLLPEDRPREMCEAALPGPVAGYSIHDSYYVPPEPAKKKGKKKGGKKGGGKKGKSPKRR